HRRARPNREISCTKRDQQPRRADIGLPRRGELRPLLPVRDVDAYAAGRLTVARLRALADPGVRAEVVEIARRQRKHERVVELAGRIRSQRSAVQGLADLPAELPVCQLDAEKLVDLDADVIARSQAALVNRHRDRRAARRADGDTRLGSVAPRTDAGVHADDERGAEDADPDVDGDSL